MRSKLNAIHEGFTINLATDDRMSIKNVFEVVNVIDVRGGEGTSPDYCRSIPLRADQLITVQFCSPSQGES